MTYRTKILTCFLILALPLALADDGFAGKKKKKKGGKNKANQASQTSDAAEAAEDDAGPSKLELDIEKRLLAYDTAGARSLLKGANASDLQVSEGRVLDQEKDYATATSRLSAAADDMSDDPAPLVYLGEVHLRAKNNGAADSAFAKAESRARALLADDPDDDEALYHLGVAQQRLRKYDEAMTNLEKARAANPRDALVAYQLGVTHAFRKEWQAAIDTLTSAIEMNSGIAYAYYYRGLSANEIGRKDLLVNDLDRFLAMAPEAPEAAQVQKILAGF